MTDIHSGASTGLGDLSLGTYPTLKRQLTKPEDFSMETPKKKSKPTPDTPGTVRVDDDGNFLPGQEDLINEHDEYNKRKKYKMVPYSTPFNSQNIFVKQPDGSFVPLVLKGKMYLLEGMSKDDFKRGIQPYNYKGVKMESDNLFDTSSSPTGASQGGTKKKRRNRRSNSYKKKVSKSKKKKMRRIV